MKKNEPNIKGSLEESEKVEESSESDRERQLVELIARILVEKAIPNAGLLRNAKSGAISEEERYGRLIY